MAVLESKPYNLGISLNPYHFSYDNGKLVGASKLNDAGTFIPVSPSTNEFTDIINTDEALDAFNYAEYGKKGVVDNIALASDEELADFFTKKDNKVKNASVEPPQAAQFTAPKSVAYES